MPLIQNHSLTTLKKLLILLAIVSGTQLFGQNNHDDYQYPIKRATSAIKLDGIIDEKAWEDTYIAKDFIQNFPADSIAPTALTEVRMAFDDQNFYVSAVMFGQSPDEYTVTSLKRDFSYFANDNFMLYMDPFLDQTGGFAFGVSPLGVEREGVMFNGFRSNNDWDNKWESKTKQYEDRWVVEMKIPFKTLRYKSDNDRWYINFTRQDMHNNERSAWAPVPRQFFISSLAHAGSIMWEEKPPKAGSNISFIPYLSGGTIKDFQNNQPAEGNFDLGFDAKVAVTSGLTLDLTVNPDFSQVEVDRQQTNLSRFELFFPERRQFFLENNDLFADFGTGQIRPFFSRRIGLNTAITGGARLTGKINNKWRVGLLNVQTTAEEQGGIGIPGQNFTVGTVQRQVFGQSNISFIAINKQQFDFAKTDSTGAFTGNSQDYNRLVGLEYNLRSSTTKWLGKVFLHKAFSPDVNSKDFAHGVSLIYRLRNWELQWNHELVGENFNAEVGFVPRKGYSRIRPSARYSVFPKESNINNHQFQITYDQFLDSENTTTDRIGNFQYTVTFLNTSTISAGVSNRFVKLFRPFDPTRTGGLELPTGDEQNWNEYSLRYQSNMRSPFNYNVRMQYGGFFNGERLQINGSVNYRFQPYGSIGLSANYNSIDLPAGFNDTNFLLIGPRIDLTFTHKLFLTTFVQYNEQADNLNLNARFQWRFKPVSDLFVVYTENYLPESIASKNRALVLKLTYWLNL